MSATRGVIVQANPLDASGSVYPTQHNTTHARTHAQACMRREKDRQTDREKGREGERDARTHARARTHTHTHPCTHTHTRVHAHTYIHDIQCVLSPGRLVLPSGCMLLLEALVKLCIKVHSSSSSCAREGFTPSMRLPHSHSHTVLTVHAPTGILPRKPVRENLIAGPVGS